MNAKSTDIDPEDLDALKPRGRSAVQPPGGGDSTEATGRGKWARKGVPHKGWTCESVEDLDRADAVCEMCESQAIRFVHEMTHPEYAEPLRVALHLRRSHGRKISLALASARTNSNSAATAAPDGSPAAGKSRRAATSTSTSMASMSSSTRFTAAMARGSGMTRPDGSKSPNGST